MGVAITPGYTTSATILTAYALMGPSNLAKPAIAGPATHPKSEGAGETGLGMIDNPGGDNEMSSQINDGIQIDLSKALAKDLTASVTIGIESLQAGAGRAHYGSNTLLAVGGWSKTGGTLGERLLNGGGPSAKSTTITLPDWGEYTSYTLLATSATDCSNGDILLGTVGISGGSTPQATPEPGTMLMAGGTLIGLSLLLKKKQKKA
jgi:hypothetical protein